MGIIELIASMRQEYNNKKTDDGKVLPNVLQSLEENLNN